MELSQLIEHNLQILLFRLYTENEAIKLVEEVFSLKKLYIRLNKWSSP